MNYSVLLSILCVLASFFTIQCYEDAGPTFKASEFTTWNKLKIKGSRKAVIDVEFKDENGQDDYVKMVRLDLVGDAYSRGYASGALLTGEILEFTGPKLDKYFADFILNIDISGVPEPLHTILRVLQIEGAVAAPKVFKEAMTWVWEKEKSYVPDAIVQEMEGMAAGICSVLGESCDVATWTAKVQQLNMLPELIRMACTAYGAWGPATPDNTLVQVRALDFGAGPFPNYTVVAVHRGNPNNPDNAFVSISFPGFVGAITGVSQSGIGISEKVWMVYDDDKSGKLKDLLPGTYNGEADIFVLRDILEYSKSKADAEAYMQAAHRTWAMWVGVGDYKTMTLDLVGYQQSSAVAYTDVTMPSMNGQPYIPNVAYVDKHPQPSGEGPTGTLPTALSDFYGNITQETSKIITKYHQTGDVHIASYDFGAKTLYFANGRINKDGDFGVEGGSDMDMWKAYNRPYLSFSLEDLWNGV